MTSLADAAAHARAMSTAEHAPECRAEDAWGLRHIVPRWQYPDPACPGCVTDADRALWARLADEMEAYMAAGAAETGLGAPDRSAVDAGAVDVTTGVQSALEGL